MTEKLKDILVGTATMAAICAVVFLIDRHPWIIGAGFYGIIALYAVKWLGEVVRETWREMVSRNR